MTPFDCILNPDRDIIFFTHGLTGHRVNMLRNFLVEARNQERLIHLVMEANTVDENELIYICQEFIGNLCLHRMQTGSGGVATEILDLRAQHPNVLISTWEAEEWFKLILRLKRKNKILFMRPYIQVFSFSGIIRYLYKIIMIVVFSTFSRSKIGLLAIPLDRPALFRSKWIDELSSKRKRLDESWDTVFTDLMAEIGLPQNIDLVLVPGFITKRKNPELITEAFRVLQERNSNRCALLFSGQVDQEYKTFFHQNKSDYVFCLDRYLSEKEYSCLLSKSKVVILAYNNRASSGVMVDCIELAKKVIFTGDGRWQNLYAAAPNFLIKGSKDPFILASQIFNSLTDPNPEKAQIEWRENREDILQFFFD